MGIPSGARRIAWPFQRRCDALRTKHAFRFNVDSSLPQNSSIASDHAAEDLGDSRPATPPRLRHRGRRSEVALSGARAGGRGGGRCSISTSHPRGRGSRTPIPWATAFRARSSRRRRVLLCVAAAWRARRRDQRRPLPSGGEAQRSLTLSYASDGKWTVKHHDPKHTAVHESYNDLLMTHLGKPIELGPD